MAEILVKAVNATHPTQDAHCYKRGDAVVVKPDGWGWGNLEAKAPAQGGKFVIIKLPGTTVDAVEKYMEMRLDIDGALLTRRLYRIIVDELPASVRQQLNQTGVYTTTAAAIKQFIENKVTQVREA